MRNLIGWFFVAHGLAHASAGIWASGVGDPTLVTVLWEVAAVGFIIVGGILMGLIPLRRYTDLILGAAVVCSLVLLIVFSSSVFMPGIAIDMLIAMLYVSERKRALSEPPPRRVVWRALFMLFAAYTGLVIATRYAGMVWGSTPHDRIVSLVGDPNDDATYRIDHVVTIEAPADSVWPWLVQLGQDRAGFYSYDFLERAIGDDIHNVDSIVPAWQDRNEGDIIRAVQPGYLGGIIDDSPGWRVSQVVQGRALVLENWGAFVIRPIDANTTLMHVRTRGTGKPEFRMLPLAPLSLLALEPAHFIMERGMLLGIKRRVERRAAEG